MRRLHRNTAPRGYQAVSNPGSTSTCFVRVGGMGRVSGRMPSRLRTEREQRAGQAAEEVGFGTCRGERKANAAGGLDDTGGDFQESFPAPCRPIEPARHNPGSAGRFRLAAETGRINIRA